MNILGKKVVLRAVEREDLPKLHKWANDPEIWPLLGGWHFPGSRLQMEYWLESLRADTLNQRFAIEAPDLGLIGTANLVDIDWKNNHAFTGLQLGEKEARGKGLGLDTVMAINRYAFEELHFERLDSTIIEYNDPSYRLYCTRAGWKEEGRRRNYYFRRNRYWDRIDIGITRQDYFEFLGSNPYWD